MNHSSFAKPSPVAEQFLDDYQRNRSIAAVAMALRLMADDNASFKSGYSLEAAALCAAEHFADSALRVEIMERLTVKGDDSYSEVRLPS